MKNKMNKKRIIARMKMETYNITGISNGILTIQENVRKAKRVFRKAYPHQKIFYAKISGKINPKNIY